MLTVPFLTQTGIWSERKVFEFKVPAAQGHRSEKEAAFFARI
jgi:hypothetical protein